MDGHDRKNSLKDIVYDDPPYSSPAENASSVTTSIRQRRKSECRDRTKEHCEEYRPSKKLRQHVPHFRNEERNKNVFKNERKLRSKRVQQDDEYFRSKPSTITNRRAERDEYKHDDHPYSSPAEEASHINTSIRQRRKSECRDQTTEHCEEYRPSKKFRQHVPHYRNEKRNKNLFPNERNSRSRRVEQDVEFFSTKPSTVTNRTAERDEEPFDICKRPNAFPPRELSPPPQSNETYKEIQNLMPGMFLLKKWLTKPQQCALVKKCQELGLGNGGFFQPSFDGGKKMCLRMMCLGMNWNHKTHKYEEIRAHDNAQPPSIPSDFVPLVRRAIEDSRNKLRMDQNIAREESLKALPGLDPDVCIVNFYEKSGKLGLHQDKDESRASLEKGLPVVSVSIGDTAEFCYGKERKFENLNKIKLESGDVLIFGGESRLVFHSVSRLYSGTAPRWLTEKTLLRPGRLNLTFRQISI